jgi:hypothetical protein
MSNWTFITFDAWRDERSYIGLAELLVRLGGFGLDLEWTGAEIEPAPEPGAEALEALEDGPRLSTLELLALVAPNKQVIDGVFEAYRPGTEDKVLRIRAVDSSNWDVETGDPGLATMFQVTYDGKDVTQSAT